MTPPLDELNAAAEGAIPLASLDAEDCMRPTVGAANAPDWQDEDDVQPTPPMLRAALDLVEVAGVRIALAHHVMSDGRCSCGRGRDCGSPGKHPIGERWNERASADPLIIRAQFGRHMNANVGIATGVASGVVVLDVDGTDGEGSLAVHVRTHGSLPLAPTVLTSRGRHIYFAAGAVPLQNRAGAHGRGLGAGLDLRAEGGFVVAPPSVHESGHVYAWGGGASIGELGLPALPQWIVDAASNKPRVPSAPVDAEPRPVNGTRTERWAAAAFTDELAAVRGAPEGTRNITLNTAAFNLGMIVSGGALDGATVRRSLLSAATEAGLSEFDASKTIRSGMSAGAKKDVRSAPFGSHESAPRPAPAGSTRETSRVDEPTPQPIAAAPPRIEIVSTDRIFAPLPPMRWTVPALQLGPGRPTLIAGYGASAKTLAMQSLALSLAAGKPVWERFECDPMRVLHIDYEVGDRDTFCRYQRLAIGHGIALRELGGRLSAISMPRVYLNSKGAEDELSRAVDGFDLVIVDSLRASAPGVDENASEVREIVDLWTHVSLLTGAAVTIVHHAGKTVDGRDARQLARGSSAIFDASGAVFVLSRKSGEKSTRVSMVKSPTSARGEAIGDLDLIVEDVAFR